MVRTFQRCLLSRHETLKESNKHTALRAARNQRVAMNRHIIYKAYTAVAIAMMIAIVASCVRNNDQGGKIRDDIPIKQLRDGDLLFRCGISAQSQVVTRLDSANGTYSHVGIAIYDNGKWRVVHSVPGESLDGIDRVKVDAVDTFFMTSRAEHGAAMRLQCDATIARFAAHHALQLAKQGIPFDTHYDWEDHSRLYCTELVQVAYMSAGIDLSQGHSTCIALPFYNGNIVFPSDIAHNDSLQVVFSF